MSKDDRIDELEAQVSEQQQIIEGLSDKLVELSGLLPEQERRQFLKAGAGAGALLAAGAVGRASAAPGDDGDTVWGSSNNRDDYYADELDANLVSTDEASVGTVANKGDISRLVDRRTPSSDTGSIQFTGLSDTTQYRVFVSGVSQGAAIAGLRINGDGASTGNYFYFDETGTKMTGQNEYLIIDHSNGLEFTATVSVGRARVDASGRHTFGTESLGSTLSGRTDGYGDIGGRTVSETLDSIELISTGGGFTGGATVAELWARDWS